MGVVWVLGWPLWWDAQSCRLGFLLLGFVLQRARWREAMVLTVSQKGLSSAQAEKTRETRKTSRKSRKTSQEEIRDKKKRDQEKEAAASYLLVSLPSSSQYTSPTSPYLILLDHHANLPHPSSQTPAERKTYYAGATCSSTQER